MRLSFNFVKSIFRKNPLVTWPQFYDFWLIFHWVSDDIIEIPKSKLHRNSLLKIFRIHRFTWWDWLWTEIKPRFRKISEKSFFGLKVHVKLSLKIEIWGWTYICHVVITGFRSYFKGVLWAHTPRAAHFRCRIIDNELFIRNPVVT